MDKAMKLCTAALSVLVILSLAHPVPGADKNGDEATHGHGAAITEQSASTNEAATTHDAVVKDEAAAEDSAAGMDEAPTVRVILSTAEAEEVRADLNHILDTLRGMVLTLEPGNSQELTASMLDAQETLTKMRDEDLAVYAEAIPGIAHLREAVDELAVTLLSEVSIGRKVASAGLPDASYSALCGFARNNADAIQAARIVFEIAQGIWSVASRACEEVAFGFNTSLLCIPVDAILFAAEFVFDRLEECNEDIDSAEIRGSYERLGHIHDDWTCKFPGDTTIDRSGHGCNGIDDDCSGVIDDCGEDVFGPVVFIDHSVTLSCYDDATEAAEAVALGVKAWDDCGEVTIGASVVNGTECDVTVDVTVTDDCGNSTTASTVVTIDADGPEITIDPAVADVCYASIDAAEQAVLDATTITDNCDALEDLEITVHSSVTECALRVRVEVMDKCGNTTVAAITVRVDPHVPTVDIDVLRLGFRGEVLAFQTPVCYETVAEAEQAVLAVTHAEDNCTVSKELVTSVSSAGDPCSLLVTSTAVDECGNENTDSETVRVDAEDPVVTCAVAIDELRPPNHTMRNVGFTFTATDNCTGEPEIEIFITSDETTASASGTGQTSPAPDAFILRDLDGVFQGILLRAERSTRGNGRVYEITVRATDECGNVGECSANVSVSPANGQPATDDGQFYDATEVN